MSERRRETELLHATFAHAGMEAPVGEPLTPPLVLTTSFHFPTLAAGAAVARGDQAGYVYTRGGNQTVRAVEQTVSRLEGAEASLVVASGMAATTTTLLTLLKPGDHVEVVGYQLVDHFRSAGGIVCAVTVDEHINVCIDIGEHPAHDVPLASA
jgi:cystathionine beta-lyase/cystathionine gamma-synthase